MVCNQIKNVIYLNLLGNLFIIFSVNGFLYITAMEKNEKTKMMCMVSSFMN